MKKPPVVMIKQEVVRILSYLRGNNLAQGYGSVYLPLNKYKGSAKEFMWQYLFPSKKISIDPRSGMKQRHHIQESGLQKAIKTAAKKAAIYKHVMEKDINAVVSPLDTLQDLEGA